MLLWNGDCIVHDEFKGLELELMKREHPDAMVLVHPESPERVVEQADVVGSTSQLMKAVVDGSAQTYIVATDNGILHRMRQLAPGKTLLEAPTAGNSATCKSCAHCPWMAMNALQGVAACLETGSGEVFVPEPVRGQALGCIERMLDFVRANPAALGNAAARLRTEHRKRLMAARMSNTTRVSTRPAHATSATRSPRTSASATGPAASRRLASGVRARVVVREAAVLCGRAWFEGCVLALDPRRDDRWHYDEGADMLADSVVCHIEADARALLAAERPALNFLQLLSGTATVTRQLVRAIDGASPQPRGCAVLDTRKTVPGLRLAQKYAVRIGGGHNQRLALWRRHPDQGEPHRRGRRRGCCAARGAGAGGEEAPASASRSRSRASSSCVEALEVGAVSVLLDNFSFGRMREAVAVTAGRALLEVSGGVGLEQLRAIAATGVDRISVGKLTKDVRAVDFSMRVVDVV